MHTRFKSMLPFDWNLDFNITIKYIATKINNPSRDNKNFDIRIPDHPRALTKILKGEQ